MRWKPTAPPTPVSLGSRLANWFACRYGEQCERWLERDARGAVLLHRAVAAQPWVVGALAVVSRLGDGVLWYTLMLMLPWFGGPNGMTCALQMLAVGLVNLVVYVVLKRRVARPRPYERCSGVRACAPALDAYSFPSGHTLHAVAYTILLGWHYPAMAALAAGFALLMAVSRIVLGLHYPTDVLVGALIGACTSAAAISLQ